MSAETEVSSMRVSWWHAGGNDQLRAEWSGAAVPDELVHHLLGSVSPAVGGPIGWMDRGLALALDVRITFGPEEIPF